MKNELERELEKAAESLLKAAELLKEKKKESSSEKKGTSRLREIVR